MTTFLLLIIFLGILIAIHEFGHFIACRLQKIDVEEFSIGFGPRILSFKDKRGTKFTISLIPFGGFVKIKGEEKSENPNPGDFWIQPFYKKIFVVIAGPIFNLLLAVFVFIIGYSIVGYETVPIFRIYEVKSPESPLEPGDSIIAIDNKYVKTIEDLYYFYSKKDTHFVKLLRGDSVLQVTLVGREFDSLQVVFSIPPVVNRVEKGSPAHKAGLKKGDKVIKLNETEIHHWTQLVDSIRNSAGKKLQLKVIRGSDTLNFEVIPTSEPAAQGTFARIGITSPSVKKRLNIGEAIYTSVSRSIQVTIIFISFLLKLFIGKTPLSSIGGPIMIGKVIYTASSYGLFQLLYLLGLISINLFIVNLLPIPAIDGWHIFIYLVEGLTKKEVTPEFKRIAQIVGFALLLILMIVIAIFDILRIIH